jgi:hypothetical protein
MLQAFRVILDSVNHANPRSNYVMLYQAHGRTFVPILINRRKIIMKKVKKIGIWMDHFNAYLMELTNGEIAERMIGSEFTDQEKESSLERGEKFMNHKEQQMQSGYYKRLIEGIKAYDEILLFGPTDAKNELYNLIKADHYFNEKMIGLKTTDKMRAEEMHYFVKEYFK